MLAEHAFLFDQGCVRFEFEGVGNEARHARGNLCHQAAGCRIQGVVEVKDPGFGLSQLFERFHGNKIRRKSMIPGSPGVVSH